MLINEEVEEIYYRRLCSIAIFVANNSNIYDSIKYPSESVKVDEYLCYRIRDLLLLLEENKAEKICELEVLASYNNNKLIYNHLLLLLLKNVELLLGDNKVSLKTSENGYFCAYAQNSKYLNPNRIF